MIAIVNPIRITADSAVASNRIAKYLAEKFPSKLIDTQEECRPKIYDAVLIVNAPGLYCDFIPEIVSLCRANRRFFYITNDYSIRLFSQLNFIKEKDFTRVANFENYDEWPNHAYVNWNQLTFTPGIPVGEKVYHGLFYYGSYREDREADFKKYFSTEDYKVHISCPSVKGLRKFVGLNKNISAFQRVTASQFPAFSDTIYIEDEANHKFYHSPANRFYECLTSGICIHVDSACRKTFETAGLNMNDFYVSGPRDLRDRLGNKALLQKQRELFYDGKNYRDKLDEEVKNVLAPRIFK